MAVYANGPDLGRGAGGVSFSLLTGRKRIRRVRSAHRQKHCQRHSINSAFRWDGLWIFFNRDLAHERTATPMICSNDAFKGLKKPFFRRGGQLEVP